MKLSTRMVVVLTSIGLLSGGFLASVNLLTRERIEINKQLELKQAITTVVPGTQTSQKVYEEKDLAVYSGRNEEGALLGFALHVVTPGFQDKITFLLGTNISLTKINSLYVIEQKETPGLGAKITDRESFLVFWENRDCSLPLSLRKPAVGREKLAASEVNTITGATVSSRAVLSGVNSALERAKALKEEGKLGGGEDGR